MVEPVLTQEETARARQYTYYWLGRLLRDGVTLEAEPVVRQLPELAPLLPDPYDADGAAADHQALFGFSLFPYEGVFLDPTAQLGGGVTDAVLRSYERLGYPSPTHSLSGDHIGCQLDLLAFLCAAEADALADGAPDEAARVVGLACDYLDRHLLRWLAPLQVALGSQPQPFYAQLGALLADLILTQRQSQGGPIRMPAWPTPPDLLNQEGVRLRDIAAYLLTPVHSGLYLSRDDIGQIAGRLRLPRGFGNREQLLLNLLRSAAQYDSAGAVLSGLLTFLEERQVRYAAQANQWPALDAVWQPWAARTAATARMLAVMEKQLEELAAVDSV